MAGLTGGKHVNGIVRLGAHRINKMGTLHMRYGMNPHQSAALLSGGPRIVNGDPSLINYLDALNAFALTTEADRLTGLPAAASFKHVSPTGVAVAGPVDDLAAETWNVTDAGPQLSAYVRARDADPKSSFGDVVAFSRPVGLEAAEFLRGVISDAVIAPGFEGGVVDVLRQKKAGRFLVFEADPATDLPARERWDVHGAVIEQDRDDVDLSEALSSVLPVGGGRVDALVGIVAAKYTQSNSVVMVRDGAAVGIGAGQQNRVDCVRLAGGKALVWWLRRHDAVRTLPTPEGMKRQDRLNWQVRFAGQEMTRSQLVEFASLFGMEARALYDEPTWRARWADELGGITLVSDGYLPFRDNVEHAAEYGVSTIIEPGGSTRTPEVVAAAREHNIAHVQTGLRLFHH